MKIGVVASGFEMLPLFQFLNKYDHEYHIFRDSKYGPRGDKSMKLKTERVQVAIEYLSDIVDLIIVDPITELKTNSLEPKKGTTLILPLFATYLKDYVLKYSLVGKIGLLCDHGDMEGSQEVLQPFIKNHILTENQKKIKKFNKKFPIWKKEVRMWKHFLTVYGARDRMVRNTIKHDIRQLRDADVDTIVPMSRGFLFYDKILHSRLNWKKVRVHGMSIVEKCFLQTIKFGEFSMKSDEKEYSVTIHHTDSIEILLQEKKWMRLLERGKSIKVHVEKV